MGKITDWLFCETFPARAQLMDRLKLLNAGITKDFLSVKRQNEELGDLLAEKTLELESLKKKIVERAQTPTMIKAKSAAEIRRMVEQNNEREFEEQANGI